MADVWGEVAASRTELADLCDSLTPEQWDAQTLCDDWKVRDIVGHLVESTEKMGFGTVFFGMVKHGFNINKMMASNGKEWGRKPTEELTKELRANAGSQITPPMTKPVDLLNDVVTHTQDIRRPLGLPGTIPEDRLRLVLDHAAEVSPILGNKKRIAGVQLIATDIDWKHGEGPEVRGTGEALLMAIGGRKSALDDLTGDGVATLRAR
jgi:uncharacterized protein (TIGR03083 family)